MQLINWLASRDVNACRRAAQDFVTALPQDPQAWWSLSNVMIEQGDWAGAKQCLTKVLSLSPAAETVAAKLCRLHLDDGEGAAAQKVLDDIKRFSNTAVVVGLEVLVAAATSDWDGAERHLRRLGTLASESPEPLETAVRYLVTRGRGRETRELLGEMLDDPAGTAGRGSHLGSSRIGCSRQFLRPSPEYLGTSRTLARSRCRVSRPTGQSVPLLGRRALRE